jgi:hypothetical protein
LQAGSFRKENMGSGVTYVSNGQDITGCVTTCATPAPWGYTYTYPYTTWTGYPVHQQRCVNCGYCPCCGKSDVPGKLAGDNHT